MRGTPTIIVCALLATSACSDSDEPEDAASLHVTGQVVDFATGQPVTGTASVSTSGLAPAPVVTVDGARFDIEPIPANSVFHVLAAVPPSHRATYGSVTLAASSRDGLEVPALSEAYLGELATAFAVSPTAARGVLLARVEDDRGNPREGVPATAFALPTGARGPYFLDAQRRAAPTATATSASGWVLFFEVAPGLVGLTAATGATVSMDMAVSPIAPAAATVARVVVTDGAQALPRNVSFANDIRPIFQLRGCESCHSGSGPGRDLGGLTLDGSTSLIFRELTEETALVAGPKRVDLAMPEKSTVLTMPSLEDPPDGHPNITFTGPTDRDYLKLLVWIREGAKNN